ncbi:CENP-B N-terminal DNA-binding domain [Popillia japonica]|uniref:CENP-B N-terminal DNA-binding domain n=1 Tax=Popillia japonica TaxID=7064 RepID=A0AAW1HSN9_POPJA
MQLAIEEMKTGESSFLIGLNMSKRRTYGRNQMQLAIEEMKTGESSLRNVAKKYNVPKSSLEFKIKNPGHKETFGPNTVLTEDEELRLVDWIKKMAERGIPRNRDFR